MKKAQLSIIKYLTFKGESTRNWL